MSVVVFLLFFFKIVSCKFYFNHNKTMKNYPSNGPACKYLRIVFFIRGYRKMCTSHSDVRTLLIAKQNSHISVILSGKLLNVSKVICIITFLMLLKSVYFYRSSNCSLAEFGRTLGGP